MMLKMGLMMMMMISDDDYDDDGCMFCSNLHKRPGGGTGGTGVLRISSDGDDRMGTKIKTQQNP